MNPARAASWPAVCLIALLGALHGCNAWQPEKSEAQRYTRWQQAHAAEVAAYADWLRAQRLHGLVPMSSLLRSSRRWRECGGEEFSIPPRAQWQAMAPTLRLLGTLQQQGLVDASLIRSGYRDQAVNACSGGSSASRHLLNNALDLDLPKRTHAQALCEFWRSEGAQRHMGLGFYTTDRIHIDTAGYRTWGTDHHRATSLCVARPRN